MERGQVSLEMTLIMAVIIAIISVLIGFAVPTYYGIHSDALVREMLVNNLAEKSITSGTEYMIDSMEASGDNERITYTVTISPGNPISPEDVAVIKAEAEKQTTYTNVDIVIT